MLFPTLELGTPAGEMVGVIEGPWFPVREGEFIRHEGTRYEVLQVTHTPDENSIALQVEPNAPSFD